MTSIFSNLPNDIILKILHEHHSSKKYKKTYGLIVKHLEEYFEEMIDEDDENPDINVDFISNGDIQTDCRFIEYNDLWTSNFYKNIINKHGETDFTYYADNIF